MTVNPTPVPGTTLVAEISAELAATGTSTDVWFGAGALIVGGTVVLVLARQQMRR
jgi:LPXTG-motif cell wall-anchored protein